MLGRTSSIMKGLSHNCISYKSPKMICNKSKLLESLSTIVLELDAIVDILIKEISEFTRDSS